MFGHDWEKGTGTIVHAENKRETERGQNADYEDSRFSQWVYTVEVTPPGKNPFQAEVWGDLGTHLLSNFAVGSTYRVEYDAKREKIRWDESDPKILARIDGKEYAELLDKVREAKALRHPGQS
jgi:hypothetical protein